MFCTECGTELGGAFCTSCGSPSAAASPQLLNASDEQIVVAQILLYVEQNWAEDFEDFIAEITEALAIARAIETNTTVALTEAQLDLLDSTFEEFISGGGYSRDERFDSLQEFIDEMDGE